MTFAEQLRQARPPERPRTWVYVAYDQLHDRLGPLATLVPADAGRLPP